MSKTDRECYFCGYHGPRDFEGQCLANQLVDMANRVIKVQIKFPDVARILRLLADAADKTANTR